MECNYRHRLVRKATDRLKMGRSSDWLVSTEGIGDRWPQVAEISRLSRVSRILSARKRY